jgi:hypothetical protein
MGWLRCLGTAAVVAALAFAWARAHPLGGIADQWGRPLLVERVHFVLHDGDPSLLEAVHLRLSLPVDPQWQVQVRLGAGPWHLCRAQEQEALCPLSPPLPLRVVNKIEVRAVPRPQA